MKKQLSSSSNLLPNIRSSFGVGVEIFQLQVGCVNPLHTDSTFEYRNIKCTNIQLPSSSNLPSNTKVCSSFGIEIIQLEMVTRIILACLLLNVKISNMLLFTSQLAIICSIILQFAPIPVSNYLCQKCGRKVNNSPPSSLLSNIEI